MDQKSKSFFDRKRGASLKTIVFNEWKRLPLVTNNQINLVISRYNLKLLEKTFSVFKLLKKTSEKKLKISESFKIKSYKTKSFRALQLYILPKILSKKRLERFKKKIKKKISFTKLSKYRLHRKLKRASLTFPIYNKNLLKKVMKSLKQLLKSSKLKKDSRLK
jgi:hypothetical protein